MYMADIVVEGPLGPMKISFSGEQISEISWESCGHIRTTPTHEKAGRGAKPVERRSKRAAELTERKKILISKIVASFHSEKRFSTKDYIFTKGSAFERKVWAALEKIPFGETRTYGDIAQSIGSPRAFRAVGRACGRNPLPLIIPCHRVVGASGKLTGFSAGLWRKQWLLESEKRGNS